MAPLCLFGAGPAPCFPGATTGQLTLVVRETDTNHNHRILSAGNCRRRTTMKIRDGVSHSVQPCLTMSVVIAAAQSEHHTTGLSAYSVHTLGALTLGAHTSKHPLHRSKPPHRQIWGNGASAAGRLGGKELRFAGDAGPR